LLFQRLPLAKTADDYDVLLLADLN